MCIVLFSQAAILPGNKSDYDCDYVKTTIKMGKQSEFQFLLNLKSTDKIMNLFAKEQSTQLLSIINKNKIVMQGEKQGGNTAAWWLALLPHSRKVTCLSPTQGPLCSNASKWVFPRHSKPHISKHMYV